MLEKTKNQMVDLLIITPEILHTPFRSNPALGQSDGIEEIPRRALPKHNLLIMNKRQLFGSFGNSLFEVSA